MARRRQVTEDTPAARIAAELATSEHRINEVVGNGQRARIADNTSPRRR